MLCVTLILTDERFLHFQLRQDSPTTNSARGPRRERPVVWPFSP
jgi:hypothetical protein